MIRALRLRDYPRLSYCLTVIADDNGINQLPPDQQVVPPEFLDRFNEGERQLLTFSDAQMDEFSAGELDSAEVLELIQQAPEAHSILDDAFDGPFHDFVFEQTGSMPAPAE